MDLLPLDLFLLLSSLASLAASASLLSCYFGILDFSLLFTSGLQQQPLRPPGSLDTWMQQPEPDSEAKNLSIEFSGLSIAVRGSPSRAADFVRGLNLNSSASDTSNCVFSEVRSEPPQLDSPRPAAISPGSRDALFLLAFLWICTLRPAGLSWIPSLLALSVGLKFQLLNWWVPDLLVETEFGALGQLGVGQRRLEREGLVAQTKLLQSSWATGFGACCIAAEFHGLQCIPHLETSLQQLDELQAVIPPATAFQPRLRPRCTLRRLACPTLYSTARRNGFQNCRCFNNLHALRAGGSGLRYRGGWHNSYSGFGGDQKARCCFAVLPPGLPEELVMHGMDAGPDHLVGPSTSILVAGGTLETGRPQLSVLLVDMSPAVLEHLSEVAEFDGPAVILHRFAVPTSRRFGCCSMGPVNMERLQYYSAEEGDQEDVPEASHQEEDVPVATAHGPPIADTTTPAGRRQKASQETHGLNKRAKMMEDQMKAPDRL